MIDEMTNPTPDPTPQEIAELTDLFGGTFHAFDEWLLTRPDLIAAGTTAQLSAYADHDSRGEAMLRITADVASRR